MRHLSSLPLMFAASAAFLLVGCGEWKEQMVADGLFKIKTPPGVTLTCEAHSPAPDLDINMCKASTSATELAVMTEKIGGAVQEDRLEAAYDAAQQVMAKLSEGQIAESTGVQVDGVSGRDFVLSTPHGKMTNRMLYKKGYLVVTAALGKEEGKTSAAESTLFVTSLKPTGA